MTFATSGMIMAGNQIQAVLHPISEIKTVRLVSFNSAILNPVALPDFRLFTFVQNGREAYPVLFDMKQGNTKKLVSLLKKGFFNRKGLVYSAGMDGCIYLVRFPSRGGKIHRFCPDTNTFEVIVIKDLEDPPLSFTVSHRGTIYGVLPLSEENNTIHIVMIDNRGDIIRERQIPLPKDVSRIIQHYQPRIHLAFGNLYIYFDRNIFVLNKELNMKTVYTIPASLVNGQQVFDVLPFHNEKTFLIHHADIRRSPYGSGRIIEKNHLTVWKPEGEQVSVKHSSLKEHRILALSEDGLVFWASRDTFGVKKVRLSPDRSP